MNGPNLRLHDQSRASALEFGLLCGLMGLSMLGAPRLLARTLKTIALALGG